MTLILSERDVQSLIDMDEVVLSLETAFARQGSGEAVNFMRTRSRGEGSVLNVMHASLSYLGRAGLKAYLATGSGAKFVIVLFDGKTAAPLAVMGADFIGRYRTGAASGVATKHLYGKKSGIVALFGSGKQAYTQALAIRSVMAPDEVRVWSPNASHREAFADRLKAQGFAAKACRDPAAALDGADVVSTITSSAEPFITAEMLDHVSHVNVCGGNVPGHAEVEPGVVGSFGTVVVDDLAQAKVEYGDIIQAVEKGVFSWDEAVELGSVVAGRARPSGRTLFKSGGAALEDVATASLLYDKALNSGKRYASADLV